LSFQFSFAKAISALKVATALHSKQSHLAL
jgi:hypothetical protein